MKKLVLIGLAVLMMAVMPNITVAGQWTDFAFNRANRRSRSVRRYDDYRRDDTDYRSRSVRRHVDRRDYTDRRYRRQYRRYSYYSGYSDGYSNGYYDGYSDCYVSYSHCHGHSCWSVGVRLPGIILDF